MKNWLKLIGQNSLGPFCLCLLLAFHVINHRGGQFLAPVKQWLNSLGTSSIAFSSKSGDLFSFRFPAVVEPKPEKRRRRPRLEVTTPKLDPANQWLAWTGLHLRAQLNQSQQRWINYPYRGKRYYFLRDEIELQYKRHEPVVGRGFASVTRLVRKAVADAGATLVIAPMPTKTSIYRDRLPAWLPEQTLWTPIEPHDKTEDARGVYSKVRIGAPKVTLDIFDVFATYHQRYPRDDLFIPSNHEWSSLGIALTSVAVIKNLRKRGWELRKPRLVPLAKQGELYDRPLLDILNLPPEFARFYQQTRAHEKLYGVNEVAEGESSRRLIVLGTCFSNRMRDSDGFANTLSRALHRPRVINLAQEGGKTLPSFDKFAKKYKRFRRGDLVIWEFNVRETFTRRDIRRIRFRLKQLSKRSKHR